MRALLIAVEPVSPALANEPVSRTLTAPEARGTSR